MRRWRTTIGLVGAILVLTSAIGADAQGGAAHGPTVICRKAAIAGHEDWAHQAKKLVGANTTDPKAISVVLVGDGDEVYLQSNFTSRNSGYDSHEPPVGDNAPTYEYPTKIHTNPNQRLRDFRQGLSNIVFDGSEGRALYTDADSVLDQAMKHVTVYVDRGALDEHGRPKLDLSGVGNVQIVDLESGVSRGSAELLSGNRPPPSLIQKLVGCCLYGRPAGSGAKVLQALKSQPLVAADARVLSLFTDSGTQAAIDAAPLVKAAQGRASGQNGEWGAKIDASMAASRGKPLFILAHTEGEEIVIRSQRNEVEGRYSIQALADKAAAQGVQLVLVGCETAKFIDTQSLGLSVIGQYRSTEAVVRLQQALATSSDAAQLLEALSGPELKLVIETDEAKNALLTKTKVMAPVKAKKPFWVQIARVLVLKPKAGV